MTTARAKGLHPRRVLWRHGVRNALLPVVTATTLYASATVGGTIQVETVFSWPGTGFLLNAAIFQRDLPLLQGTILILALFFVVLNLLVDILQTVFDPRIERG